MSNRARAPYVKATEQASEYGNLLGSYATHGRLAKLTKEVDYTPLVMDKRFRPQVSNLYEFYTHIPGLIQGKNTYFTMDRAYNRH